MLNLRFRLGICIVLALIVIVWLGPLTGATFNGQKTFLLSLEQGLSPNPKCNFQYSSSATFCTNSYKHAGEIGVIICSFFGLLILVCIFQVIRLDARNHNNKQSS
jgi:hypothetical protein